MAELDFNELLRKSIEDDERAWQEAVAKLGRYLQSLEDRIAKLELNSLTRSSITEDKP